MLQHGKFHMQIGRILPIRAAALFAAALALGLPQGAYAVYTCNGANQDGSNTSVACGNGTYARPGNSIAIGSWSGVFEKEDGNTPFYRWSSATNSVAIGNRARNYTGSNTDPSNAQNTIAIGNYAATYAADSTAIGDQAKARGKQAIAVGQQAEASGESSMAYGYIAKALGTDSMAMGTYAEAEKDRAVAIGNKARATDAAAVAIGDGAEASKAGAVALGSGSVAGTAAGVMGYYVIKDDLYDWSDSRWENTSGSGKEVWQSTLAAVSVGDVATNKTRQITGVAAGSADTDAVNVAQLKSAGFYVNANENSEGSEDGLTHNLTKTLSVKGGMGSEAPPNAQIAGYSARNLAAKVVQDAGGNNTIYIQQSESPKYAKRGGGYVEINPNGQGTINGLSNTYPVNRSNYTSGQAATEDQLVQQHFFISANGKSSGIYGDDTVYFTGDNNINVDLNGHTISIKLNPDLTVDSVTIDNGGPRLDVNGLDMAGKPITNLADGRDPHDAVNKGQLDGVDNRLRAGIAGAVAQANIPQVMTPGAHMLGAGLGHFRDQTALGVGWSARSDNGHWVVRGSVGLHDEATSVGGGIGYEF